MVCGEIFKRITMNRIIKTGYITLFAELLIAAGCSTPSPGTENPKKSMIPVEVTSVTMGQMVTYIDLNSTSAFLLKADVKSPVTGYIDNIYVMLGEPTEKSQLLLKIRTREANAIKADTLNNLKFSGVVDVKAATAGIVSAINHSIGDYVAEGDQLCQLAIKDSYVFILDVPFELSQSVKLNTICDIVLPDNQMIKGIIKSRLPSMATNSQTEKFIVRLTEPKNLPENLSGKIKIVKETVKDAISLPKSSILTDETMKSFWVMKLINDSMAVKVPVTPGISTEKYIQILRPDFKASDMFLTSGNYGLGDTVQVKVQKSSGNGQ